MRNGLFHPGGRRVDHTTANGDDDDEEEQDDSAEKVSHDPSEIGDEGEDDESAEESGEHEDQVQENRGSDAEDLNAERRAERLADRYGGIPEDYLGKDVDKIIQTRREARQQSLIDAPKGHLSLFPPRNMDEESDEEAPAQAPPRPLASNAPSAPRGGRGGFGPRMQQVNSPSGFPETPAMAGNFVPGAGAMSVADSGIDPSYDVTSPADQAMYAFEQQQKLMGLPSLPMEGGGIVEQNIPLPRFGGVQEPQMPQSGGAPQMEQDQMMDRPKPEVKFVDPRFRSVQPAPQRMPMAARGGFAQRAPAEAEQEEEEQEEAPQRPAANAASELRFRAASKGSKASASKWDHSQSHITQRFLTNIGYARQQRALQRRRENGRARQHDAAAPEAQDKQEEEHETQQQNLGIPPPPDFQGPALMEEEARVHAHTAQGHAHGAAQTHRASSAAEAESEAVPPRRTRYERMFARPAPRARRGSLLEVDAASEEMDSIESREVQGKPAGLPDMPEFEAPPPDPAAAQQTAPTGPAGLREEVYSPPHVVV